MGVMMMTLFSLCGIPSLFTQNALKIFLSLVLNTASVIVLLAAGLAVWSTSRRWRWVILGGYAGGRVMNHLPQHWLRAGVVGFSLVMSGYFLLAGVSVSCACPACAARPRQPSPKPAAAGSAGCYHLSFQIRHG